MAKGSIVKTLLAGVAGGAIALSGGAAYEAIQGNNLTNTTTSTTTTNSGGTKVSTTSVKVTSDTTAAISKVSDAVVSVLNYQPQNTNSTNSFFGNSNSNSNSSPVLTSEGSGVIYKKAGNTAYIVTNNHVVSGASSLQVMMPSGKKVDATLVGTDSAKDLAVIKIDATDVTDIATFGDSSKLTVGEPAIAIGSPLGTQFKNSATQGIISSLSRLVVYKNDEGQNSSINALQTDAAINPGNSGGALINIAGQVIGINSSKLSTDPSGTTTVEGMGFSIPSNDVVTTIKQIEQHGNIVRPGFGASVADLSSLSGSQLSSLHLPSSVTSGAVIAQAPTSGVPASDAGLQAGDVITKLGNFAVTSSDDLISAVNQYIVGDSATITYYRNGQQKTATVHFTLSNSQLYNLSQSQSNYYGSSN